MEGGGWGQGDLASNDFLRCGRRERAMMFYIRYTQRFKFWGIYGSDINWSKCQARDITV